MRTMLPAAGLALLLSGPQARAATIGTGPFDFSPHIIGRVAKGEADEVSRDFAAGLTKPLSIDIHPLSDPPEVLKIGLWLQQQRLAVQLKGSCVGACARSILLSGRVQRIKPGAVIAFGGMTEVPARIKDQMDAGEFFIDGDERSQASRERFLQSFQPLIDQSMASRGLLARQVPLPAQAQAFIDRTTGDWRVHRVSFAGAEGNFSLTPGQHQCLWWVPDAEGLRQLGLDVPGYRPASRAEAAKLLKVPEGVIYVGPALAALPEQPLCEGAQNFSFPLLP